MPAKAETKIVTAIMDHLRVHWQGDAYHVHGSMFQRSGEPDIDGSVWSERLQRWLHLKIEVKTATGNATKLQMHRIHSYKARDYVTGVVRSIDDVEQLIKDYECSKLSQE